MHLERLERFFQKTRTNKRDPKARKKAFPTGLRELSVPEDPLIDVVLIHDLTAGRDDSWNLEDSASPWPAELSDNESRAHIVAFGYNAQECQGMDDIINHDRLKEFAEGLLSEYPLEPGRRPIIFIAHGFGGLIYEQALTIAFERSCAQRRHAAVLLGTPHHGAGVAEWAIICAKELGVLCANTAQEQDWSPWKEPLDKIQDMQKSFRRIIQEHMSIKIAGCFATKPIKGTKLILSSEWAVLPEFQAFALAGTHLDMTKHRKDDPGCKMLLKTLRRWSRDLTESRLDRSSGDKAQDSEGATKLLDKTESSTPQADVAPVIDAIEDDIVASRTPRLGDRDNILVPIPQDIGPQRSELQRSDRETLGDANKYTDTPWSSGHSNAPSVSSIPWSSGLSNAPSESNTTWSSGLSNAFSASSTQTQLLRFGNQDYMLVPIHEGGGLQPQIWTQRSELHRFDSESLKNVKEYRYKRLPGGKKRIRLVQLMSGETQSPDIFCEFIQVEYDKTYHVPVQINSDKPTQTPNANDQVELPSCYDDDDADTDEVIREKRKRREDFELVRWHELEKKRDAMRKQNSRDKKRAEKEAAEQLNKEMDEAIDKKIAYEALSWCRGTDEPKYAVKIIEGGKTYKVKVERELALALKYLRLPHEARTLWIDAICINQDDPEERNHQIQMMSRIYTRAEQVCVWLGEDTTESKVAIDFIREEVMKLHNFDIICSDKRYVYKWQALMMLMQAPWFSCRWVIQEIALARDAVVYCGKDSILWKEFAVAVELFVEVESATHRLSEIMQKDEKFRHLPGWFEYVSELGASILVQATGKVFRAQRALMPTDKAIHAQRALMPTDTAIHAQRAAMPSGPVTKQRDRRKQLHKVPTIDPLERQSLLSLEFLVSTMFIFKAAEPRDVVYSLLSIARDAAPFAESSFDEDDPSSLTMNLFDTLLEDKPFPVDYSRPYSDVCRDFVRFVIRRKSELDPTQALDILCRPWALTQPKSKSKVIAIHDAEKSQASYKERRVFGQRSKPWKRRICEIKTISVNGQEKRKLIKKPDDKWELDPRTNQQYFKESEDQRPLDSLGDWAKYKDWCDQYKERAQTKARKQAALKVREEKNDDDDDDEDEKAEVDKDLELPSWVAQASRAPITLDYHPGMRLLKTGRANADPLVGQPTDGHRNYNAAQTSHVNLDVLKFRKRPSLEHHSMYVQGFELDEVVEIEDASQGGDIPVAWLRLGGWEEGGAGFIGDPPDWLWRTLVADRGRDNRNPPYYYARACRESVHRGSISSGRVDTAALINNERNSIVAEFCRRVHAVIWNRRMFRTKSHRLGLAYDVEKGDKVCILYGCTVPVILKTRQKKASALDDERFEDNKQALVACIRQWENNCERKFRHLERSGENRKKWIMSGEWKEMMDAKKEAEDRLKQDAAKAEKSHAAPPPKKDNGGEEYSGETDDEEWDGGGSFTEDKRDRPDTSERPSVGQEGGNSNDQDKQADPPVTEALGNLGRQREGRGPSHRTSLSQPFKREKTDRQKNVEEARKEDPKRYHLFRGDCYLHGMMDGEAMREKSYQKLPDRIFELR